MRRSLAVAAAPLVLPLVVLTAVPTAAAAEKRSARPTVRETTLLTDAMPTRISATSVSGRVTCVRVSAGAGRDRRVWLELRNDDAASAYVRVRARGKSGCLLAGEDAPKGTRLEIVVEEDVLGPFNPRAEGSLTF